LTYQIRSGHLYSICENVSPNRSTKLPKRLANLTVQTDILNYDTDLTP